MKTFFVTAGAACALAAAWTLPSLAANTTTGTSGTTSAATNAAGTSATTDTSNTAGSATNAATGGNGTSTSNDTNASGSANGSATAAGTTATAGANASGSSSSAMDIKSIDVNRPFGDTTIDTTQTPQTIDATLTDAQRTDLQDRCNAIVNNKPMFQADVPAFCMQYLEYWKTNHPAQ